jgi:hypothetical protein
MLRHALLASAALGVMGACLEAAKAADFRADAAGANVTITEPMNGSNRRPEGLAVDQAMPVYGFDPSEFDDVGALELDVTRIAGALGLEVDRSDAQLLGRVALRVVDDPRVGALPSVTDVDDPYVRMIEEARTPAPVRVHDVAPQAGGVAPQRGLRLDYARPVTGDLPGELEVAVEPRANVLFGEQVSGVGGGAIVRFGRNLTAPREERSRWYAFLGADTQALTGSLGGDTREDVLRLEDKQMVGDYQAGVAVRVGQGDLAFGFVHREVSWNDFSREEQFIGVSFTRRR